MNWYRPHLAWPVLVFSSDNRWVFANVPGTNMKRINVSYFYDLGAVIRPLVTADRTTPVEDVLLPSILAKYSLQALRAGPVPLKYCLEEADNLLKQVTALQEAVINKSEIAQFNVSFVINAAKSFETTLLAELRDLNVYFVSPVGIFSTSALLTKAEEMFGEHSNLLPEITVNQIKEAGKCLAFSLGSAAAFHLFAALESVLRTYYDQLSSGAEPPKNPSMGAYLGELSKLPNVDKKLLAALWQVKDLHRNPAIHFETILTTGEALTLVGMIHSAISTTLDVVSKLPKS